MAPGGTTENPVLSTTGEGVGSMAGTSVATAKVTGAASQVWAANPEFSYRQVIEILKETATDINTLGWDAETGAGLLNMAAAVGLARTITPVDYEISPIILPEIWNDFLAPRERAARVSYTFKSGDTLWGIAQTQLGNGTRWVEIQKANGSTYTSQEARSISVGTVIYLPGSNISPPPTPPVPIGSLAGKKIALDPGHGNSPGRFDPGAVANGTTEAIENMVQAQIIANYLRQRGAEVKIIDDGSLGLEQIGQQSSGSDLFVSLHLNSAEVRAQGHEVYFHSSAPAIDSSLARTINNELDAIFPDSEIPNRGVKTANFVVLRGAPTSVPAVLVESLFINSPGMSRANVEKAAEAIARGIEKFLTGNISTVGGGNNGNPSSSSPPATAGEQRKYQVRSGDTLSGIALTQLGNANRWKEIMKTPSGGTFTEMEAKNITPGQYIYLPVSYQIGTEVPSTFTPSSSPKTDPPFSVTVKSSNGINLRTQPNTTARSAFTIPPNAKVTIDQWTYGERVTDLTTLTPDELWFRVTYNGQKYWIPSGWVKGYPPSNPPVLKPSNTNPPPSNPKTFTGKAKRQVSIMPMPSTRMAEGNTATPNGIISAGTTLTFNGYWNDGESIYDPEARAYDRKWFHLADGRGWVSSAFIDKNPPAGISVIQPYYISPKSDNGQPPKLPALQSNPTEIQPLRGFMHPLGGSKSLPLKYEHSNIFGQKYAQDFGGNFGDNVFAMYSGVVSSWNDSTMDQPITKKSINDGKSGTTANYLLIKLDDSDEKDDGYKSLYLHLQNGSIPSHLKKVGARVQRGELIGKIGYNGISQGVHLHAEINIPKSPGSVWNRTIYPFQG